MAAARIVAFTAAARLASLADDPAPPVTLDVVRRQRQLLRRATALCLEPIAEEADDMAGTCCVSGAANTSWASSSSSSSRGTTLLSA
ncbi:unnamed protein product [Urochloa humidicola]